MKNKLSYEDELKQICKKLTGSFAIRFNTISALQTEKYIKRLIKLNSKTKNEHIDEIASVIGRSKYEYKKYCSEHNYISDPYVNKKIKEAYIKLSQKSIKIKTSRKNVKNNPIKLEIEYNSDRGSYNVIYENNGKVYDAKQYTIKNIKNIDAKRARVLKELTAANYGINIFDELQVKESNFKRVNPDIIHILIQEGRTDYAKMYVKEVVRWRNNAYAI